MGYLFWCRQSFVSQRWTYFRCIELGTHYCDITGETDWVRKMIDKHDDKARETGARIVHFCGHDCVPWDLSGDVNHDAKHCFRNFS